MLIELIGPKSIISPTMLMLILFLFLCFLLLFLSLSQLLLLLPYSDFFFFFFFRISDVFRLLRLMKTHFLFLFKVKLKGQFTVTIICSYKSLLRLQYLSSPSSSWMSSTETNSRFRLYHLISYFLDPCFTSRSIVASLYLVVQQPKKPVVSRKTFTLIPLL